MVISEKEMQRRTKERAKLFDFFYRCIVELDDILKMGLAWDDAVGSVLLEYGWDLVPADEA